MNKQILLIDENNQKIKWLSTSLYRVIIFPIIDTIVLLLVVETILFLLNEFKIAKLVLLGDSFNTYLSLVLAYIIISMGIAIFDLLKYISLKNKIIVKENDNITIIKGFNKPRGGENIYLGSILYNNSDSLLGRLASLGLYASGTIEMQKDLNEKDSKTLAQINNILDERSNNYKYIDYKNCKLLNETKKHFEYVGEKNGVSTKFKIKKVYLSINF